MPLRDTRPMTLSAHSSLNVSKTGRLIGLLLGLGNIGRKDAMLCLMVHGAKTPCCV